MGRIAKKSLNQLPTMQRVLFASKPIVRLAMNSFFKILNLSNSLEK